MKAIILAAGRGSRLSKYTTNVAKCFLPIKHNQMIIERMLFQLKNLGISDVLVVLGYQSQNGKSLVDEIKPKSGMDIGVIVNEQWATTGTLASLLLGLRSVEDKEDVLVIEGDVVCDNEIVEMLGKAKGNVLAVDRSVLVDAEAMKFTSKDNLVVSLSKSVSLEQAEGEYLGLAKLEKDFVRDFICCAEKVLSEFADSFYEKVVEKLVEEKKNQFRTLDVRPWQWTEIDFSQEYKKARQIFSEGKPIIINDDVFKATTHSPSLMSLSKDLDVEIKDFCYLANPYLVTDRFVEKFTLELKTLITTYPPLQDSFQKTVSRFYDEKIDERNILVGNGATELISIIVRLFKDIVVPVPTFSEYLESPGCLRKYYLREEDDFELKVEDFARFCNKKNGLEAIVVINPNNPVGRLLKKKEIEFLLKELSNKIIILDESFIEFADYNESLVPQINNYENLIIVKSFGKIFGVPGIRLGAVFAHNKLIAKIKQNLPIWNVNSLAAYFLGLLNDKGFKKNYFESLERVKKDTYCLYQQLLELSGQLKVYSPTANYVFAKICNGMTATHLRNALLKERFYIRDCTNKEGLDNYYVRIASRTREENNLLVRHLITILADFEGEGCCE